MSKTPDGVLWNTTVRLKKIERKKKEGKMILLHGDQEQPANIKQSRSNSPIVSCKYER